MSSFTGWKVLVNFLLPPPMLLTFLLVLPFPRNVRKGILLFTSKVLSFSVLGGMKFVHLALILSGVPLIDSGFRTFKSAKEAVDHELTPNQRISVLAKKWREERNFWIAAMAFTLWCLLTVLYAQVGHAMKVHDRLDAAEAELNELKGIKPPAASNKTKVTVPGAVAAIAHSLGLSVPKRLADAAAGHVTAADAPAVAAAPAGSDGTAGFPGFRHGKKEEDASNATEPAETELTPSGASAVPATRRRAAAVAGASME